MTVPYIVTLTTGQYIKDTARLIHSPDIHYTTCSYGVFTPEQDNDKTNVEPVHSYDAFHARSDVPWCERHHRNAQVQHLSCRGLGPGVKGMHRNAQVQHLSCRCLVAVLLWCENTLSQCHTDSVCTPAPPLTGHTDCHSPRRQTHS